MTAGGLVIGLPLTVIIDAGQLGIGHHSQFKPSERNSKPLSENAGGPRFP